MEQKHLVKKTCIVGMGELVWDIFPDGKRLGGAPSNFTYLAQQLCGNCFDCFIASNIGVDSLGDELSDLLDSLGFCQDYIHRDPVHNTGTVDVYFNSAGMPEYTIKENAAWDFIPLRPKALALACDVFCFGSQGQRQPRSRESILDFLKNMRESAVRIFDINLRQHFYTKEIIIASLEHANVLKINDEELKKLASLIKLQGDEVAMMHQLQQDYQLRLAILTRGEHGSLLLTESELDEHSGFSVSLVDSVGAGDAFTAATAIGLLQQLPLQKLNALANRVAAYVCTQPGATPVLPDEIVSLFANNTSGII